MSFTLYDASIPVVRNVLASLTAILKKGEAAANAASLPKASIHPDMNPLSFQVIAANDIAIKMQAYLTGVEPPETLEDTLKTFPDFYALNDKVDALLAKTDKATINKRAGETVPLAMGIGMELQLPGPVYMTNYVLPNILFHLTTAYDILRKEGVPLGKADYLGTFLRPYIPSNATGPL